MECASIAIWYGSHFWYFIPYLSYRDICTLTDFATMYGPSSYRMLYLRVRMAKRIWQGENSGMWFKVARAIKCLRTVVCLIMKILLPPIGSRWAYGGKEEKLGVCLITCRNSGRLNINCKAITLEIYSYWCYMDYVASLLNESFSFFLFFRGK